VHASPNSRPDKKSRARDLKFLHRSPPDFTPAPRASLLAYSEPTSTQVVPLIGSGWPAGGATRSMLSLTTQRITTGTTAFTTRHRARSHETNSGLACHVSFAAAGIDRRALCRSIQAFPSRRGDRSSLARVMNGFLRRSPVSPSWSARSFGALPDAWPQR